LFRATVQEQQEIVAELKLTMAHAQAEEHLVSLRDIKNVVRDCSLEKIAVEKERVESQIEMKKVGYSFRSYITFQLALHPFMSLFAV
jgi:hypothetical protein